MAEAKTTILVIEDEPLLLEAITKKLALQAIEPLGYKTGQEAIAYLKTAKTMPDAVWLDFYLRDRNGLEFVESLKENEKWATIPVVVVSNSTSPENVKNMMEKGVKKYLLKAEYRLEDIIKVMLEVIENDKKEKSAPQKSILDGEVV